MATNIAPNAQLLLSLTSVTAAANSKWIEMTGFSRCTYTVRLTNTTTIAGGQIVIRGTNAAQQDAASPALLLFTAIDAGTGFTLSGTTGVLTFAPTAGTYIQSFVSTQVPTFLQASLLGGATGGGTVSLQLYMAAW